MAEQKKISAPRVVLLHASLSGDGGAATTVSLHINGVTIIEEVKEQMNGRGFFGNEVEVSANGVALALGIDVEKLSVKGELPREEDWDDEEGYSEYALFLYAQRQLQAQLPGFDRWAEISVTGQPWAHVAARAGLLPADFDQWEISVDYRRLNADEGSGVGRVVETPGWTVAHEAASHGLLPQGFTRLDLARGDGWTVAHILAVRGELPEGFDQWDLATTEGNSVRDIAKGKEEREARYAKNREAAASAEKVQQILDGEAVVADDEWLDSVELPLDVVSIPNPDRVGLRDVYLVGKIDNPVIHEWRVKNGIVDMEAATEKKIKMGL